MVSVQAPQHGSQGRPSRIPQLPKSRLQPPPYRPVPRSVMLALATIPGCVPCKIKIIFQAPVQTSFPMRIIGCPSSPPPPPQCPEEPTVWHSGCPWLSRSHRPWAPLEPGLTAQSAWHSPVPSTEPATKCPSVTTGKSDQNLDSTIIAVW